MPDVLIIEDHAKLAHNIQEALSDQGYATQWANNGTSALASLDQDSFHIIVLDLGLPDIDGIDLLASIRERAPLAGIIIATARDKLEDRIFGLEKGGDDYLVKPFALVELIARVKALLRRTQQTTELTTGEVAGISIDYRKHRISIDNTPVDLPPREYDLLVHLIEHRGNAVSRDMLAQDVWQVVSRATSLNNVIDVHISRLRERLQPFQKDRLIKTIRGVGFTFDA